MVEVASEHLKNVLTVVQTNLAMAKDDLAEARAGLAKVKVELALKKGKREVELVKARDELSEAYKEVQAIMEKQKASLDFMAEQAHVVVIFWVLKQFFDDRLVFSQKAFKKGYELSKQECCAQVADHHSGLDLALLDEQEGFKGEPYDHGEVAMSAITTQAFLVEPVMVSEPASINLIIGPKPLSAKGIGTPFKAISTYANPIKKVVN